MSYNTDHGNVITVSGLVKKFGDFTAVDNISFEVKKAEIFAFLGPNGAGKSTTIKMLTTLLHPTQGTVTLNGHDTTSDRNGVRKSIGIVFQDPSLDDDLTAMENMEFHATCYKIPHNTRKSRIEEMLRFVELWDKRDELVKTFSGGMKRRLEIARGLLHHPAILFLDEPTLGLDPQTRNHMWSYVKDINEKEGMTVFFTTHYMEEADRVADRIAVMDHGRTIATGTPSELKAKTGAESLEDAFLTLTGHKIREEEASGVDRMRMMGRVWGGRRR